MEVDRKNPSSDLYWFLFNDLLIGRPKACLSLFVSIFLFVCVFVQTVLGVVFKAESSPTATTLAPFSKSTHFK